MKDIPYPTGFHNWGFTVKASWLADNHYAKNYPAACAMLASKKHPKRHVIPPDIPAPEHVRAFVAEQERRNLW